jgi:regulator of sigma E protease
VVLGVLVFVHELGHYISARIFGVKAYEFGFGLPPRICGWKKVNGKRKFFWGNQEAAKIESEDTIWSLNWLPIGGFVQIKGADTTDVGPDSCASQKPWKRAVIMSAGVTMNFLLAGILLSLAFMIGAPQVLDGAESQAEIANAKIQVYQVMPDTPAQSAGLAVGDEIIKIDSVAMSSIEEVQQYIAQKDNQEVTLQINHLGEVKEIKIIPKYFEETKSAAMGVALVKTGLVSYPWYVSIWLGFKSAVLLVGQILSAFYHIIKNLIVGLPAGVELAGPVGIAVMTGQMAKMGFVYVVQFAAMLSINLAIINFLPFPALDGGRVVFIIIEKIRRKPVNQKVEAIFHTVGFALLMILVVVVTSRDIFKFKDSFVNLFNKIVG